MSSPASNFPGGIPGEPASPAPRAVSATPQPTTRGPRIVKVKAHTRVVRPKAQPKPQPQADPYAQIINNALNTKYGPAVSAVNQAIGQSQASQGRLTNWFQDYQNRMAQTIQAQQQAAQNMQAQLLSQQEQTVPGMNAQATQSRNALGNGQAGTLGLVAQNNAAFLQALQSAGALQGQQAVQTEGNRQAALRGAGVNGMRGLQELAAERGNDAFNLRTQLKSADQKAQNDAIKNNLAAQALGLKVQTLNNVQIPLANSLMKNRRSDARTQRIRAANQKMQSDRQYNLDLQKFGAQQAKDNYQKTHGLGPYRAGSTGTAGTKYIDGIHRGSAILRVLHGTPPAKDGTGAITKPNPFYNLDYGKLVAHKQDFIDLLQSSSKAGHLNLDQATRAVNQFLKEMKAGIVPGLSNKVVGDTQTLIKSLHLK